LILDSTKTYVKKIAATGVAYPWSDPMGAAFNFTHDKPINDSNDQISIQFRCIGAMYQDDILVSEFNQTTELFNDLLKDKYRNQHFVKIPIDALALFNNRGYPRINTKTYELEWWVSKDEYNYRLPFVKAQIDNRWQIDGDVVNFNRPTLVDIKK
jgi:hypothetical protein